MNALVIAINMSNKSLRKLSNIYSIATWKVSLGVCKEETKIGRWRYMKTTRKYISRWYQRIVFLGLYSVILKSFLFFKIIAFAPSVYYHWQCAQLISIKWDNMYQSDILRSALEKKNNSTWHLSNLFTHFSFFLFP